MQHTSHDSPTYPIGQAHCSTAYAVSCPVWRGSATSMYTSRSLQQQIIVKVNIWQHARVTKLEISGFILPFWADAWYWNQELIHKFILSIPCKQHLLSISILTKSGHFFSPNKIPLLEESLTGGNWQKWKRVFLTCPCHKIYRDEAVGLKSSNILEKLRNLWQWEIWGNIVKIWYFVNNFLIEARI